MERGQQKEEITHEGQKEVTEAQHLRRWLPDEPTAVLVEQLFHMTQVADDLADGDVSANAATVAELLHLCLVEIPSNPRHAQFWPWLAPIVSAAIQQWAASEEWRRSEDQDVRRWGWAMRDAIEQVIPVLATQLGGFAHGQAVAVEVGLFFRTNADRESCEQWEIGS